MSLIKKIFDENRQQRETGMLKAPRLSLSDPCLPLIWELRCACEVLDASTFEPAAVAFVYSVIDQACAPRFVKLALKVLVCLRSRRLSSTRCSDISDLFAFYIASMTGSLWGDEYKSLLDTEATQFGAVDISWWSTRRALCAMLSASIIRLEIVTRLKLMFDTRICITVKVKLTTILAAINGCISSVLRGSRSRGWTRS